MTNPDDIMLFDGRPAEMVNCTGPERGVYDFLDKTGVSFRTLCHAAAWTMEECEAVRKAIGAPVFKNLFLSNRQQTQFYLLMMPADKPFKTKYLSGQLGCARLSFAPEEAMWEYLHIHPGAVSPLGLIYDTAGKVRLIVDSDLQDAREYACHPCVNTASVALSLNDLLDRVIPVTGHDYTWVNLPSEV